MKVLENISYGDNYQQLLDLYVPDLESFPVFVYFHGGGLSTGGQSQYFVPDLCKKGVAVVTATYRKYPEAKYPEFIEDAATVIKWAKDNMKEYGKVTKFIVGGTSAGAYLTMMLCFNKKFLSNVGLSNEDIDAWYHNTGQITTHFNVLKEMGMNHKQIVIDEKAPIYYINGEDKYPPMEFTVTSNDMPLRHEQHTLLRATFKNFGYDMEKITFRIQKGDKHGSYVFEKDDKENYIFADMICEFINKIN